MMTTMDAAAQLKANVAVPFTQAHAMPKIVYTSEEFAAREVAQIFSKEWFCVGRATALAFARLGAHVIAANRRAADGDSLVAEIAAQGGSASFVATDVTQPAQIRSLMDDAVARHGRLDVVFNNAGYQEPRSAIADTPEATASTKPASWFGVWPSWRSATATFWR